MKEITLERITEDYILSKYDLDDERKESENTESEEFDIYEIFGSGTCNKEEFKSNFDEWFKEFSEDTLFSPYIHYDTTSIETYKKTMETDKEVIDRLIAKEKKKQKKYKEYLKLKEEFEGE